MLPWQATASVFRQRHARNSGRRQLECRRAAPRVVTGVVGGQQSRIDGLLARGSGRKLVSRLNAWKRIVVIGILQVIGNQLIEVAAAAMTRQTVASDSALGSAPHPPIVLQDERCLERALRRDLEKLGVGHRRP